MTCTMAEIKNSFDFLIDEGYEDRYVSSVVEKDGAEVIDVTDTWIGTPVFSLEEYKSGDTEGFLITFPGDNRDSILVGHTADSNPWGPMASELDKYDHENKVSAEKRLEICERKLDEALDRENKLYAEKVALEIKYDIVSDRAKAFTEKEADYKEACDRLQTVNLIKDEQKAKADELLSCLKELVTRDLIKDSPVKKMATEIVKKYDLR